MKLSKLACLLGMHTWVIRHNRLHDYYECEKCKKEYDGDLVTPFDEKKLFRYRLLVMSIGIISLITIESFLSQKLIAPLSFFLGVLFYIALDIRYKMLKK